MPEYLVNTPLKLKPGADPIQPGERADLSERDAKPLLAAGAIASIAEPTKPAVEPDPDNEPKGKGGGKK